MVPQALIIELNLQRSGVGNLDCAWRRPFVVGDKLGLRSLGFLDVRHDGGLEVEVVD